MKLTLEKMGLTYPSSVSHYDKQSAVYSQLSKSIKADSNHGLSRKSNQFSQEHANSSFRGSQKSQKSREFATSRRDDRKYYRGYGKEEEEEEKVVLFGDDLEGQKMMKSPSAKSVQFRNIAKGESVIDDFFKTVKPL